MAVACELDAVDGDRVQQAGGNLTPAALVEIKTSKYGICRDGQCLHRRCAVSLLTCL